MTITGNQKAASVLRDDVSELSLLIIAKYKEKLKYLSYLKKLSIENSSFLLSNDIEGLLDNITEETHVTEVINVINFDLSELITQLVIKFNKKFTEFETIIKQYDNQNFVQITELRKQVNSNLSDLKTRKNGIILALDAERYKISKDKDDISRIRHLYKTFPDIIEL